MINNCSQTFLVVPKLIEQTTWGGSYILNNKNWYEKKDFQGLKIGQSYELFSGSMLRDDIDSSADSTFTGQLGYGMQPNKIFYQGDEQKLISLNHLIKQNPQRILGTKAVKAFGAEMKILVKFTQAKGNSFQMHVQQKDHSSKWRFKPESWYFFEKGLTTLGVKKQTNWNDYQNCCLSIEKEIQDIGKKIQDKVISISSAKEQIEEIIKKYNPWQYVNLVKVKKDELIDLSKGGIHHSWEKNSAEYPNGNILYEVQLDVMDPTSTIRCFDKGKIGEDGSTRKLNIDDYFKYIDRSDKNNDPMNHLTKSKILLENNDATIISLQHTEHYSLDKMMIRSNYSGSHTSTMGSFHHLFVKVGKVVVESKSSKLELTKGHSCFIPAGVEQYSIQTKGNEIAEVLKTFI